MNAITTVVLLAFVVSAGAQGLDDVSRIADTLSRILGPAADSLGPALAAAFDDDLAPSPSEVLSPEVAQQLEALGPEIDRELAALGPSLDQMFANLFGRGDPPSPDASDSLAGLLSSFGNFPRGGAGRKLLIDTE